VVKLSSTGEVGQFVSVTQFDDGNTSKCGFYATATAIGGAVAGGQAWSASAIASSADQHYAQLGSPIDGMDQSSLHTDLSTYNVTGKDINPDWGTIKANLNAGYPVIICLPEVQVFDKAVGGSPYPWDSAGLNHVILLTGVASDGNVLVRDSANITPPNNIRPGPRTYIIANMSPYWATAVSPAWLTQGGTMSIPAGWHDDGTTLTAPNGIPITQGFRTYVLGHNWDSGNYPVEKAQGLSPLELSNTNLGAGTRQTFRTNCLEWTSKMGVFESWVGAELYTVRNLMLKAQNDLATTQTSLKTLQDAWNKVVPEKNGLVAQVNQLNAQIAQLKAAPGGNTEQLQQQLQAATTQIQTLTNKLAQITSLANQVVTVAKAS